MSKERVEQRVAEKPDPEVQRRLKASISDLNVWLQDIWPTYLKTKEAEIPPEVREVVQGRMSEAALVTFWMLPTPWLWRDTDDDYVVRSESWADAFVSQMPVKMWEDGYHNQVIDYFSVLADNMLPLSTKE